MAALKQLKVTLKFAAILLVLAQQNGVTRSIECYRDMRLVSPFYQQLKNEGVSACADENAVCAYLYINATASLTKYKPAVPKGLPLSYIYQGCMKKDDCESYCRVNVHLQHPNKTIGCFRRCCNDTNYCNIGETFSACSADKPCLNYGECKRVQNSTYCQCRPEFYGSRCEKKTTNRTVCGEYGKAELFQNGTLREDVDTSISVKLCRNNMKCGYGSYSYEILNNRSGSVSYSNVSLHWGGFCIDTSWCLDACMAFRRKSLSSSKDVNIRFNTCNLTCCDGDFCNIKNASEPGKGVVPTVYPDPPRKPSDDEKLQAVILRILKMMLKEWDDAIDKKFKKAIASLVSSFCKTNRTRCGLPEERRSRRAAGDPLYTEYQVHLLPSYPKQNGSDLLVAFYIQKPAGIISNISAVPGLVLEGIVKAGLAHIQAALNGRTVTEISSLYQSTPAPPTTPTSVPPKDKTWMYIVIGVCCGFVVVLVIIIVVVVYCKKKNQRKGSKTQSLSPDDDELGARNRGYHKSSDALEMDKVL